MEITTVERITPEIAKEYLSHNTKNRKINKRSVESLARDIKNNKFVRTHQGIAFDTEGTLIDGQHRLLAVIMANKPIEINITRGLQPEAAMSIDRGVSRSLGDVMRFSELGDNEEDANVLRDTYMLSAINQMVSLGYKKIKLTSDNVISLYNIFKSSILNTYRCITSKTRGSVGSAVASAAIAALYCGVAPEAVERFFGVMSRDDISGCSEYNVQVALNWKRQLDDAKIRRVSIDRKKVYLGTQNAIYHFVNNTNVTRVMVPRTPKYDVERAVKSSIDRENE